MCLFGKWVSCELGLSRNVMFWCVFVDLLASPNLMVSGWFSAYHHLGVRWGRVFMI